MNRSPRVWGPTADEFRPERWDDLTDDASSPYAFEPFSNGPRVCIAKQFAMLEMSVMLIELITCFRFGPSPEQDLNKVEFLNPAITYRSKNGLNIRIEKL
jgi:cytochrome P450